jgi:dihydropteroate synthase
MACCERTPFKGRRVALGAGRTHLMGVVNITPDSFSDGGYFDSPERAVSHARTLVAGGATLVDLGAESTRPGAPPVSAQAEWARLEPVLQALEHAPVEAILSVDTYKAEVADRALRAGVEWVNDVSGGLLDPDLFGVVARHHAGLVIGHLRGTPATMREHARYRDVVGEVREELALQVERARMAGVARDRLWLDPGLGFSKSAEQSLELLARLEELQSLGLPLVVGASRKSFLGELVARPPNDRDEASVAAAVLAIRGGASILRVHAPERYRDALLVADAVARVALRERRAP